MTSASASNAVENFRRQCEARHWLAEGYGSADRIGELMERIAKRRGQAAAEALRDEMRVQWKLRQGDR